MDNDEQRDLAEELDAAMIPYRENLTKIFEAGWNLDNIREWMRDHGASVEVDNDGQVILYTGLIEAPDRSLWADMDEGEVK